LVGCQSAPEVKEEPKEGGEMSNTFDSFTSKWEKKASEMLEEGLKYLVQLDSRPAPSGVFGGFVDRLAALPFAKRHTSYLIRLIEKSDPFLQEAGLELACAAVELARTSSEQTDIYEALEPTICRLLDNGILDPWILLAIVKFAKTANDTVSPELFCLFRGLAEAAYGKGVSLLTPGSTESGNSILRSRARGIEPIKEAKELLDDVMLTRTKPTPRTKAILPFLEKAHKTKGWQATRDKILKNRGIE